MKTKIVILCVLGCAFITPLTNAQGSEDAARYFNRTVMGTGMLFNSAGSMTLHGNEFSSVYINPASTAFLTSSSYEMGLNGLYNRNTTNYLVRKTSTSTNLLNLSTINAVFKVPTKRGSLVFSAGYTQLEDFNESFTANGFNQSNSIADFLATSTNGDIRLIGFNGYATDTNRVSNTLQSVYRFDSNGFRGIGQYIEQEQAGEMGEFVLNMATEFQKNLFVGFSLGIPVGTYNYERIILEEDTDNLYAEPLFNVNNMLITEKIRADIAGIYAKVGLAYQPVEFLRVGLSYQTAHNVEVNEDYSYRVFTTYDDGFVPSDDFPYNLEGEFSYRIQQPSIIQAGFSIVDLNGIDVGFLAEFRNYNGLRFNLDSDFKTNEIQFNRQVQQELQDVVNLSIGAGYRFNHISFQTGVTYMPDFNKSRNQMYLLYHGGVVMDISPSFKLNLGIRLRQLELNKTLYTTGDFGVAPNLDYTQFSLLTQAGFVIQF